jgi:hypothetical protein
MPFIAEMAVMPAMATEIPVSAVNGRLKIGIRTPAQVYAYMLS